MSSIPFRSVHWCALTLFAFLALSACSLSNEEEGEAFAPAPPAQQPTGEPNGLAIGDALETTPAAWWWYSGQSAAQVSSLVSSTGGRIVSLQVEAAAPLTFTVALVHNSGAHAKTWWWVPGQTSAQLAATVSSTGGRIVSLHPYVSGSTTMFAAVLIANSGADAATWWWYPAIAPAQLSTQLAQNNARLVDLNRYTAGGTTQLAAVAMSNSGAGARTWWWYTGVAGAQLGQLLTQNGAMLTNLEPTGDGSTFDAVMEQSPTPARWWWYAGQSSARFGELMAQNGARPLDVKTYVSGGARLYAGMMVNNSNAATTRVGDLLRGGSDGASGLYLKEIGGAVEAGLQEARAFEPASTLKILVGLHAMRNGTLTQTVSRYAANPNSSCPTNTVIGNEPMSSAIREMLTVSDNQRTRVLTDRYGFAAINQTGTSAGLSAATRLNHIIGCGGPTPNSMTLVDAGKIYEGLANASLLSAANRDALYALMPAASGDFSGVEAASDAIVDQEAAAFGLSAAQVAQYKTALVTHYKGGSYDLPTGAYRSIAGSADIPRCSGATKTRKQYVFGVFIHGASNATAANNSIHATKAETLREPIRAGLATWATCSP